MNQWYALIAGRQYGPVGVDVLGEWLRTGRLHAGDLVWTEGMPDWQSVATVPPLTPFASAARTGHYAPPDFHAPAPMRMHRGSTALTLGIISCASLLLTAVCGVGFLAGLPTGIIAWVLAQQDLNAIRAGKMIANGQGTLVAGRILGLIGTILSGLAVVGGIVMFLLFAHLGEFH